MILNIFSVLKNLNYEENDFIVEYEKKSLKKNITIPSMLLENSKYILEDDKYIKISFEKISKNMIDSLYLYLMLVIFNYDIKNQKITIKKDNSSPPNTNDLTIILKDEITNFADFPKIYEKIKKKNILSESDIIVFDKLETYLRSMMGIRNR